MANAYVDVSAVVVVNAVALALARFNLHLNQLCCKATVTKDIWAWFWDSHLNTRAKIHFSFETWKINRLYKPKDNSQLDYIICKLVNLNPKTTITPKIVLTRAHFKSAQIGPSTIALCNCKNYWPFEFMYIEFKICNLIQYELAKFYALCLSICVMANTMDANGSKRTFACNSRKPLVIGNISPEAIRRY